MQQAAEKSGAPDERPSSLGWKSGASPTFAGILAALAAPAQKRVPAWNDDDLADDVAALSYEQALRKNARYRSADLNDLSLTQSPDPALTSGSSAFSPETAPPAAANGEAEIAHAENTKLDRSLKSASVTIRLTKEECAQLHDRAAEAGLTVSAYLRSCAFEVEMLRTQVKETLERLRSAEPATKQTAPATARRSWLHWPSRP